MLEAVTNTTFPTPEKEGAEMSEVAAVAGIDLVIGPEDSDSLPEGFELLEDERVEEPDGPITLKDVAVLEGSKNWVVGRKVLEREKKAGKRAGLRAAKALERQQHLIPVEWRGKTLVFMGTVALYYHFSRCVACLYWDGNRWDLYWYWLSNSFDSNYRAMRISRK